MVGRVFELQGGYEARGPRSPHDSEDVRIGLYGTEVEAQRVVDLLSLKRAMDSGAPLEEVSLHLPLQEYSGNDSTMQYLRDHDLATVWDTFHACAAGQLEPAVPAAAAAAPPPVLGATPARGWWELDSEGEQEEGLGGAVERPDDSTAAEPAQAPEGGAEGSGMHEGQEEEEEEREASSGDEADGSSESDREWRASRRREREQGTGRFNAAGRPLRVAATRRKLPLPAPGERDSPPPSAAPRPRPVPQSPPPPQHQQEQPRQASLPAAAVAAAQLYCEAPRAAPAVSQAAVPLSPRRSATKTILFPPVPASMRCLKCINCQNPQRKRPCVLARRRLLELLREQEGGQAGAGGAADIDDSGGAAAEGASASGGSAPHASGPITALAAAAGAAPASAPGGGGGLSPAAAAVAALHMPARKLLFPIIPPGERCGQCKPCLNPRLKKACREARRRQLEAGLAPLLLPGPAFNPRPPGDGNPAAAAAAAAAAGASPTQRKQAASAAAVAAGRQLGASVVGCRLRVYWPAMRRWYEGRVVAFQPSTGEHHIDYDDGDQQLHLLAQDRFVLLDPPAASPMGEEGEEEKDVHLQQQQQQQQQQEEEEEGQERRVKRARASSESAGDSAGADGRGSGGSSDPGSLPPSTPAAAGPGAALLLPPQQHRAAAGALLAAAAVAQLPAALAACCRGAGTPSRRAAAAGVTSTLVGRFMAAFSCRLSEAQRGEHATFLLPLLEAECFEGVQACMEEVVFLSRQQQAGAGAGPASPHGARAWREPTSPHRALGQQVLQAEQVPGRAGPAMSQPHQERQHGLAPSEAVALLVAGQQAAVGARPSAGGSPGAGASTSVSGGRGEGAEPGASVTSAAVQIGVTAMEGVEAAPGERGASHAQVLQLAAS